MVRSRCVRLPSVPTPDIEATLTRVARHDAPRVLSVLATRFRDLDLADEAVQDALADAARAWPRDGIPDNTGGWLMTAAHRRAIDSYRRRRREVQRRQRAEHDIHENRFTADVGGERMIDDGEVGVASADERLRLVLLCCHPALDIDAQVALTLRLVGGLTVTEISRAFLVPEATLAQRIVRAKRKIRTAGMTLEMPSHIEQRLDAVLVIVYLVFNEGYLSHGEGNDPIRSDFVDEAVRLAEVVAELAPDSAEALGLVALCRFHRARSAGRFAPDGGLIVLGDQDRSTWDLAEIGAANGVLGAAMTMMRPGRFQIEAMIGAEHANARTATETNWPHIVRLYAQLSAMTDSPVIALNHAVAVAEAEGPLAGLTHLDRLTRLDDYHLFWATRGELHRRAGSFEAARTAFDRALTLTTSDAERRHLLERRSQLPGDPVR